MVKGLGRSKVGDTLTIGPANPLSTFYVIGVPSSAAFPVSLFALPFRMRRAVHAPRESVLFSFHLIILSSVKLPHFASLTTPFQNDSLVSAFYYLGARCSFFPRSGRT